MNPILVSVEDEVRRRVVLQMLSSKAYTADILKDTRRIIKKLSSGNYQVLIIDITGFNRDPCPLLQKIREEYPGVSIIALANRRLIYTYSGRLDLLAYKLLLNPLNPDELLNAAGGILHTEDRRQRTEDGRQRTEDRGRTTEKRVSPYEKKIIAVGGGKGGVGKSVTTANLAAGLAAAGKQVIAVDVDLGGPNLHTCFGIKKLQYGLFDFLLRENVPLADIVYPTGFERLKFIGITDAYPGAANIKHTQKLKLIDSLKKLDADYILLDLGSGATWNVIDFFSITGQGIIVSSPEITSILNTYSFIKSVLYREMERMFRLKGKDKLFDIIRRSDNGAQIKQTGKLEKELIRLDPDTEEIISDIKRRIGPGLILNMVQRSADRKIGDSIKDIAKKHLNIDIEYLGFIQRDNAVEASVISMSPFILSSPSSTASACLKSILSRIMSE